jgi:hypothetical protein
MGIAAVNDQLVSVIRVSFSEELGMTINRLRAWLDSQQIQPSRFNTSIDAKGYTLKLGFRSIDDATLFRAQFAGC